MEFINMIYFKDKNPNYVEHIGTQKVKLRFYCFAKVGNKMSNIAGKNMQNISTEYFNNRQ